MYEKLQNISIFIPAESTQPKTLDEIIEQLNTNRDLKLEYIEDSSNMRDEFIIDDSNFNLKYYHYINDIINEIISFPIDYLNNLLERDKYLTITKLSSEEQIYKKLQSISTDNQRLFYFNKAPNLAEQIETLNTNRYLRLKYRESSHEQRALTSSEDEFIIDDINFTLTYNHYNSGTINDTFTCSIAELNKLLQKDGHLIITELSLPEKMKLVSIKKTQLEADLVTKQSELTTQTERFQQQEPALKKKHWYSLSSSKSTQPTPSMYDNPSSITT